MANAHRTNALVTSCLKTPVDPHTKAPLASYERERVLPYSATGHLDNRDYEKELEYDDSGSDFCDEDCLRRGGGGGGVRGGGPPLLMKDYRAAGDRLDLSDIFFSNEEYYSKLEELKKAHLRTMAELETMYRHNLQLQALEPLDPLTLDAGHRLQWVSSSQASSRRLRKSHSAFELRRSSGQSDSSDEERAGSNEVEKGLLFSPKEHIKNMWLDFKLSPHLHHLSSSSLPADQRTPQKRKEKKKKPSNPGYTSHRTTTVPRPFQMTLREDERRKRGIKTRSEMELENAELRRQLDELTECQTKFRASPVPAHVHLPLYEELQERHEERRRSLRDREEQNARTNQKPFSFLERERLKKEQRQQQEKKERSQTQETLKPFKAKPVPRSVYAAASGEQLKEEQLYRSIRTQMRAQETLQNASVPPSMLARRLNERSKKTGDAERFSHRPQINSEVPDFHASYRRFQKQLEKKKEVRSTTACEPFALRTSQIPSHRERILADIQKEHGSPRTLRWPYVSPAAARTANSSLCSSLSGSMELLPAKDTDATKKRHEAVRKALEQRRKAEEEEEQWKERQKQREKKLQRVVVKRAQANDPHVALSETQHTKLKEFRKQARQRRKEYQQEIREIQERVKGRPLLLEQVAQRNAKQQAEKRYTDALHGCDLTEEFISSKAARAGNARQTSPSYDDDGRQSEQDEPDAGYEPVRYRKVFLDDEDMEVDPDENDGRRKEEEEEDDRASSRHRDRDDDASRHSDEEDNRHHDDDDDHHYSDDSFHYSDDHERYSDDDHEHDNDDSKQQEAAAGE